MCRQIESRQPWHIYLSKAESQSTVSALPCGDGWYEPEALNALQQLFEAVWLILRKQVFPWDVEANRERLAKQIFEGIPNAEGNVEELKQEILAFWQAATTRQRGSTRRGSCRQSRS